MRIQTRGNSTTVWLSNDVGVIDGTMSMSAPTLEKILQAVNEKYGTSFEGWSQLPTAYEVGDTVPNWNAYEKIEMPPIVIFKYKMPNGGYCAGYTQGEKAYVNVNVEQNLFNMDTDGKIEGVLGTTENVLGLLQQPLYRQFGILYAEILGFEPGWSIGETVENWNSYILIE